MGHNARCILPGLPYHVTQRGTDRQKVFFSIPARKEVSTQVVAMGFRIGSQRGYDMRKGTEPSGVFVMKMKVSILSVPSFSLLLSPPPSPNGGRLGTGS
jgi:hypothetical protein